MGLFLIPLHQLGDVCGDTVDQWRMVIVLCFLYSFIYFLFSFESLLWRFISVLPIQGWMYVAILHLYNIRCCVWNRLCWCLAGWLAGWVTLTLSPLSLTSFRSVLTHLSLTSPISNREKGAINIIHNDKNYSSSRYYNRKLFELSRWYLFRWLEFS